MPELKVVNKAARMVLILDGEELVGAKQNRIVNTTILVDRKSTLVIPVSCVEHGRWSYNTSKFNSQNRMMSSELRAMKSEQVSYSIRSVGQFRSNQGAIWEGIAEKAARRGAHSPSVNPVDSVRDTLKGGSHERRPMHGPIGIDLKGSYE